MHGDEAAGAAGASTAAVLEAITKLMTIPMDPNTNKNTISRQAH